MPFKYETETIKEHGVRCTADGCSWSIFKMNDEAKRMLADNIPCNCGGKMEEYRQSFDMEIRVAICKCGSEEVEERYSLGITAGHWCPACWKTSGYRKEGREGFDPTYAGESYDPID